MRIFAPDTVQIRLDIPAGLFDDQFPADQFEARVREFAMLELIRARRLHEHEAAAILGLERWELVARMERAGIVPTEREFEAICTALAAAIAARGNRSGGAGGGSRS
ncbi:MAG TPA: hypothetical protein VND20_11200 [Candidatus Binataceae bacterium]|nr:hypothetical protein [Candidatus Binataceae bacterium]